MPAGRSHAALKPWHHRWPSLSSWAGSVSTPRSCRPHGMSAAEYRKTDTAKELNRFTPADGLITLAECLTMLIASNVDACTLSTIPFQSPFGVAQKPRCRTSSSSSTTRSSHPRYLICGSLHSSLCWPPTRMTQHFINLTGSPLQSSNTLTVSSSVYMSASVWANSVRSSQNNVWFHPRNPWMPCSIPCLPPTDVR